MKILDLGCGPRDHFEDNWRKPQFREAISRAIGAGLESFEVDGIDKAPSCTLAVKPCQDSRLTHFNAGFSAWKNTVPSTIYDIILWLNPSAEREILAYAPADQQQLGLMLCNRTPQKVKLLVDSCLSTHGFFIASTDLPEGDRVLSSVTENLIKTSTGIDISQCSPHPQTASGVWTH